MSGNYGTEFIFAIPHNIEDESQCTSVLITIASGKTGTYGLIIPYLNMNKTRSLQNMTEIILPCSLARSGTFTDHRGIYLQTSNNVSVCVTNYYKDTAETFLVLPVTELGYHYGVAAYEPSSSLASRFIMVVATSNNTNGYIYDGNAFRNFSMSYLDIYQFSANFDIQSMTVTSDNPVAVITGTSCATIPYGVSACDVIFEQMIPFQSLDNVYIAPPTPPKEAYELKVTHFNNSVLDTTCFHNSTTKVCTNNSTYFIRMGTSPTVIISKTAISIAQFGFGNGYPKTNIGDPYMTVIQGLKNYLNSYRFAIPTVFSNAQNHISVTVPTVNINGLILDGSNLSLTQSSMFNVSAPLENYTVAILDISSGYHHIFHINRTVKFGLLVYGLGAATDKFVGFGYPGGMQLSMFESSPILQTSSPAQIWMSTSNIINTSSFQHQNGIMSTSNIINTSSFQHQSGTIQPSSSTISSDSPNTDSPGTTVNMYTDTSEHNETDGNEMSQESKCDKYERNTLGIALGAAFGSLALLSSVACLLFFALRIKMKTSPNEPENDVHSQKSESLKN